MLPDLIRFIWHGFFICTCYFFFGIHNSRNSEFLEKEVPQNPAKKEYLLPTIVNNLLHEGKARLQVLSSADRWYGVTYAADKPMVVAALKAMADEGKYPVGLWK